MNFHLKNTLNILKAFYYLEISFLEKYNVSFSHNKLRDCMLLFANVYGEWNEYFKDYKWQKLSKAAKYYGYDFDKQEHNSLADVFATKFVYEKINDIK